MNESENSSEDRLSDLPDSIIIEIYGFLLMREVVQTTILSKRWNNLWKTTPYLDFDGHAPEFVNRALILWKGSKILRFKFNNESIPNKSVFSDVDVWVCLAKENGMEELYLEDLYIDNDGVEESYCVPHSVYSCSSLKVLSLLDCKLQHHSNVQWNQLTSLEIKACVVDENVIKQVVSGSPRLEVFSLNLWETDGNFSIRSSSLKKLLISRNFRAGYEPSIDIVTELRIWSPNLETLDIDGEPFDKCTLKNVPSLTHLNLEVYFKTYDIAGETVCRIFPAIKHVEEGLGDMEENCLLSPLSNVKFLKIDSNETRTQYKELMDLLHIFPNLESLVLYSQDSPKDHANNATSFLQVEKKLPESFLLQLRTVEISLIFNVDNLILPFIEILLKHASELQKMSIRVQGIKPGSTALFLEKLLRMPRSSPTVELIFSENFS